MVDHSIETLPFNLLPFLFNWALCNKKKTTRTGALFLASCRIFSRDALFTELPPKSGLTKICPFDALLELQN